MLINGILQERDFEVSKKETELIIAKYRVINKRKAENIEECGNFLEFALKENLQTSEKALKLHNAKFCRERYCPMCIKRRQKKLAINFYKVLKSIEQEQKVRYISVTFTVKNCEIDDLKETVKHMNKSFNAMSRTKRFKGSIKGFLRATEFVGNHTPNGEAHPHFHCLFVVPSIYFDTKYDLYIKQEEWVKMWRKALKVNYDPSVYVRIIRPKKQKKVNQNLNSLDNVQKFDAVASAIAESVKYPIKSKDFLKLDFHDFHSLTIQTRGLRLIASGGIVKEYLKKLKIELEEKKDKEDLVHISKDDEDIWRIIAILRYEFESRNKHYKLVKVHSPDGDLDLSKINESTSPT